eukprot:gene3664-42123_t
MMLDLSELGDEHPVLNQLHDDAAPPIRVAGGEVGVGGGARGAGVAQVGDGEWGIG